MKHEILKNFRYGPLILFFTLLYSASAMAQQTVKGTVSDTSGNTLPDVNILVKGTSTGTVTNAEGHYSMSVSSFQDTLVFSSVGYRTKTIPINGQSKINITLDAKIYTGQQMVVIGYESEKEEEITGAVSSVKLENVTKQPASNVVKSLQGQVAGVRVTSSGQPGETSHVRIRGSDTFGDNSPLYVVDGIPTKNIDNLSSFNIASMQVLKDAASASIYGARASNGVIIITTKKGKGEITINYKTQIGVQIPSNGKALNIASPKEQAEIIWQATKNSGGNVSSLIQYYDPSHPAGPRLPDYIDPAGKMEGDPAVNPDLYYVIPDYKDPSAVRNFYYITKANKQGTNWFDKIFDPALTMKHSLAVSGGGESGSYLFSIGYDNHQGILIKQYLKRYAMRVNTEMNVSDAIRIGENFSYSLRNNPIVSTLGGGTSAPEVAELHMPPIVPVYDIMGNYAGSHAKKMGTGYNPVALRDYATRNSKALNSRLMGSIYAEVYLWKHRITLKTIFGGNINNRRYHSFDYPTYALSENFKSSSYNRGSANENDYTWTNTITYKQTFKDVHNVDILLGTEAYKANERIVSGSTKNYFIFDPAYTNLDTGFGNRTNHSSFVGSSLFSLFGRLKYNYKNKYLVSVTMRRDGSSKFLYNRYGMFPAGSIGWVISDESFFPDLSWLAYLKLRGGYGIMGNQLNVNPNNAYTLFTNVRTSSFYPINGSNDNIELGFQKDRIGNPYAKWEKDKSFDIGINSSLWNGSINLAIDYYRKSNKGILYNPQLSGTAGTVNAPYINIGGIVNKGIDAEINISHNITNELQFKSSINFSANRNKITKVAQNKNYFSQENRENGGGPIVRNAVDHPISSFYGYKIIGFWNSEEEIEAANAKAQSVTGDNSVVYQTRAGIGRFRYKDINGDNRITPDDRTFLGDPIPAFIYGVNLGFNYKNLDFSMFWYGSQGNDIWNRVKWWHDFVSGSTGAKSRTALYDSWRPDHPDAKAPILETNMTLSNNGAPNSYFVENGSYLRLKTITLGYTLPQIFSEKFSIERLRLYFTAANILTITNYSGLDPSIGYSSTGTSTSFGIDEGVYPTSIEYLIGLNLQF